MPRPGVDVEIVETFEEGQAILDTSQGMFAGYTERGAPLTTVKNMADYRTLCGGRNGASVMYDAVTGFFAEGGKTAYIARNAAAADVTAVGSLGTWSKFVAKSGGLWGNDIDVTAVAPVGGADAIRLQVKYQDVVVESSPNIANLDAARAWTASKSAYINVGDELADSDELPAVNATVGLTTGANGAHAAADYQGALNLLTYDLGPAQVNCPGEDDTSVHLMVGEHCELQHRVGVLDLPNTDDPATLQAAVESLYGAPGSRLMLGLAPWLIYPSDARDATNVIPFGGVEMGMIAKVDGKRDASLVAAGAQAISRRALGLANTYSDADRALLNAAGVSLARFMYRQVRTYGYRTVAGPEDTNWLFFQESRVIMNIAHQVQAALEEYVFNTVDGNNHLYVKIKNACVGILMPFYLSGALYGRTTADESFRVVCDDTNNTPETVSGGEVHVTLYLRTAKIAEWIKVDIIKVPTDEEVPVAA